MRAEGYNGIIQKKESITASIGNYVRMSNTDWMTWWDDVQYFDVESALAHLHYYKDKNNLLFGIKNRCSYVIFCTYS